MQVTGQNLGDLTGPGKVDVLREMPVDLKKPLEVDKDDAHTVRQTIYRLTKESDKEFMTARTPTGILVWRTA